MSETNNPPNFVDLAAGIVSAYLSNNTVPASEIPNLINEVHAALTRVARGPDARREPQKPAVPPKRSVTPEHIVCLEDGKKFKSLRRHLKSQYGLTPEQSREKWGLPADYPMVAPNYAATRSALAKKMGLGRQRARRK
jgi:predicted transcriptional regulator